MTETEWRNLGVQQSPGWIHYMMHGPGKCLKINGTPKLCVQYFSLKTEVKH